MKNNSFVKKEFVQIDHGIVIRSFIEEAIFGYVKDYYYPAFVSCCKGEIFWKKDYSPENSVKFSGFMEKVTNIVKNNYPEYGIKEGKVENCIIFCKDEKEIPVWFFRVPLKINKDWEELLKSNFVKDGNFVFVSDVCMNTIIVEQLNKLLKKE